MSVVIPAFNEERTVGYVVSKARDFGDVILVDDGSTDGTARIAEQAGATVIRHHANMGQSAAMRTGYLNADGETIATIDSDLQQLPHELSLVIEPVKKGKAEMVIGSRYLGDCEYIPSIPRYFIEKGICRMVKYRFGVRITNPFSGMRAMRKDCIDMNFLKGNGHECAVELAFSFASHGYRIIEVPRTAKRRNHGNSSVRFSDGWKIIWRTLELSLPDGRPLVQHRTLNALSDSELSQSSSAWSYPRTESGDGQKGSDNRLE